MELILISGKMRTGKDTACQAIISHVGGHYAKRYGLADELKEIAKNFGWNGKKDGENRTLLIDIGQIMRNEYSYKRRKTYDMQELYLKLIKTYQPHRDFWCRIVFDKILYERPSLAIIPDIRFKNEIAFFKARSKNCKIIRVNRDGVERIDDRSENDLDDYCFDVVIDNNGSKIDFENKVINFVGI